MTRSHLSLRDLANEVTIGLTARPARTLLTALGTIIGVASLVATLGLAKTAGNRIVSRFDELEATTVTVTPSNDRVSLLPFDAESRLDPLNGVVASGTKSDVAVGDRLARSVPVVDPLGQTEFQIPVIAVSPGLFDAARARLATGSVLRRRPRRSQRPGRHPRPRCRRAAQRGPGRQLTVDLPRRRDAGGGRHPCRGRAPAGIAPARSSCPTATPVRSSACRRPNWCSSRSTSAPPT
ncbi:MAG: ABC transporter permease [Acidimicrobiales bacterium]